MIQTEDSVEILEVPGQAEGESGAETTGFSTFGAQRINDAQKRRCRPTNISFQWNNSGFAAQRVMPTPVAYWGTFITSFDGTILAGSRNDGLGSTTRGWAATPGLSPPNLSYSDGTGGNVGVPIVTNQVLGLPGSRCGFDMFINTTKTNIDARIFYFNPYFPPGVGGTTSINIIVGKVPQIGEFFMPNQPPGTAPFLIIRRRPEGYFAGEDGAQVFLSFPYASEPRPAGFIDPTSVFSADFIYGSGGGAIPGNSPARITTDITP